jgi:hypothetical protein
MEARAGFPITPRLVLGLFVMLLGVLFLLDSLEIVAAREFVHQYWPVVIIAMGLVRLFQASSPTGRVGGIIWSSVGLLIFMHTLGFIHVQWHTLWPLALVFLGIWIVWRAFSGAPLHRRFDRYGYKGDVGVMPTGKNGLVVGVSVRSSGRTRRSWEEHGSTISMLAIMAGVERKNASKEFRGGDATAIMGGAEIDLTDASIEADCEAVIDVFAMWGGIDIIVPGDWTVTSTVLPIMGGVEDSRKTVGSDPNKRLLVKGMVLMGGVEIKN